MSERDYRTNTYVSNRELLCKASVQDLEDKYEAECLYEYRNLVKKIMDARAEVQRLSAQPKSEASIKEIETQISRYNVQLSVMESTYPLRYVIQRLREKEQAEPVVNEVHEEPSQTRLSLKERLAGTFGCFGLILFYGIRLIISILPFVMIDANFFVTLLLIGLETFLPFTTAIFWIWGLVCAINGVQDVWAIIYYIVFVVAWIPFYISTIASLFKRN